MNSLKSLALLASSLALAFGPLAAGAADTRAVTRTVGPNGEAPVPHTQVVLSATDQAAVQTKGYKAAILMHTSSDFTNAVTAGAKDVFDQLGIRVVATTDAEMDSKKQLTDLETVLALRPDMIISLVIDPVSAAVAYRKAVAQGVRLVFISNAPKGFKAGTDYAGIVTDDLFGMGKSAAELLSDSIRGKGDVALMYHDANYYVTNQRDAAVKTVLAAEHKQVRVVASKGIANPNDGQVVASALLTQNPGVKAIYAPWDAIAEGVLAAAREAGRKDLRVVTMDLGAATVLDMAKGGNMAGVVSDLPFDMGQTLARMGALALLNKPTPAFVTVDAVKVTKSNLDAQWQRALRRPLPPSVLKALAK
ncbi:LacI family transcriptional regulator [Verminephrobacter aporrectodeae subsp. tuberculatae]|uniref:substrate-binding domain-containing protein n=1 Tax=Verminephrobacter aporrectodeae TaxID=1110389 RepID=UPI00223772AA|nr:substrate-binding domain-containing protein [Verminephrobacter aporrectodeae]MCW5221842.1 LacI family transcriptional regulator [Verminephrobacter aporrectodeae subsp. tuberculatae]MCW5291133.1 LacI family transcriptional regulator [Verminephrobacter aporrectodeae subsp. tuberculatae]